MKLDSQPNQDPQTFILTHYLTWLCVYLFIFIFLKGWLCVY